MNELHIQAKEFAKQILTGSDRITKKMRADAIALVEACDKAAHEKMFLYTMPQGWAHSITDRQRTKFLALSLIEAIKEARREFGFGLREAKEFVERVRGR